MRMTLGFCVFAAILASAGVASACEFAYWRTYKDTAIYRNSERTAYIYATEHKRIDADGAPNAYHPDDIGKHCTRDAHIGLDCPANAGYPKTRWWHKVLTRDPKDPSQAYVQPSGPYAGFFVSQTWLATPGGSSLSSATYVDATQVPYIVFPGTDFAQIKGTGWKGDVGFAINLGNGTRTSFVVADQGGGSEAELGEGSIALFKALGATTVNARTGAGAPEGLVLYVVFPGSRKQSSSLWPRTNSDIETLALRLLETIGGADALEACRSRVTPR